MKEKERKTKIVKKRNPDKNHEGAMKSKITFTRRSLLPPPGPINLWTPTTTSSPQLQSLIHLRAIPISVDVSPMATDTQPSPSLTFPSRVLGIPLVSHSLDTIHSTLSTSPYTKGVYQTGSGLAQSAYDTATRVTVSSTVYPRLQPVITAADGYANKGLDTIQSKFPYPFEAAPEKVYSDLKKAPEDAKTVAYKTIDERITTPAYGFAKGVDSVSAPFFFSSLADILSPGTDSDRL